jgi:hypothetical protein
MELKNVQIIKIKPLQQVTATYKKVEFIVKLESQYPQEVQFEIAQDKADNFIKFNKEGQFVDIEFNLRGRSYLKTGEPESSTRWFNSLDAWKVFKSTVDNTTVESEKAGQQFAHAEELEEDDSSSLPF